MLETGIPKEGNPWRELYLESRVVTSSDGPREKPENLARSFLVEAFSGAGLSPCKPCSWKEITLILTPFPLCQGTKDPPLFWMQTILETSVTFGHFELSPRTLMIWVLSKYIAALRNSPYICPSYF